MTPDADMTGGLKVTFDGHRLILKAPAALQQLAVAPEQWRLLALWVLSLGDNLFQVETRRVERVVVCPECGIENDDDEYDDDDA